MNTNQLVTVQYNNEISIDFTSDAWFNATEVAAKFGKRPADWMRLASTQEYIDCLTDVLGEDSVKGIPLTEQNQQVTDTQSVTGIPVTEQNQWVTVVQGGESTVQGTWVHPKLAVAFARWLNPRFAVWCDDQIYKLLKPTIIGCSQESVVSLVDAAVRFDRLEQARISFEHRTEILDTKRQGLSDQQWEDLGQVMYNISSESLDADRALRAIKFHFNTRYRHVDISFDEALRYLSFVRRCYEQGYEPKFKGGKPVEDSTMV
jgi:hypothetical protein